MAGVLFWLKDIILKRWFMVLSGKFCMFEKNAITKISSETLVEGIPEWLSIELLLRLPATSVCRFKVVSRQWLSLISSPYFVHAYASRHSPRWAFLSPSYFEPSCPLPEHPLLGDLLGDLHSGVLRCPISNRDKNLFACGCQVYEVSNGLVLYKCLYKNSRGKLHANLNICNPITKQCIVVPRWIWLDQVIRWGFLTNVEGGILRSYTVVVFVVYESRFELFFSEIGEWKSHTLSTDSRINGIRLQEPVDVDGILHWLSPENGIIAYDPHRDPEVLRLITFPTDADNAPERKGGVRMCGTHKRCLRYLEYAPRIRILSVWVLNDYGRGDNWCLQHQVNCPYGLAPISFHPLDSDMVYLGCDTFLVSFDMRARKMRILKAINSSNARIWRLVWRRPFTLMIPPLPVSIPSSLQLNYSHPQSHCS